MIEKFYNGKEFDYSDILENIRNKVKEYLVSNKIESLVIGISGGLDSGVNCAILKPVCTGMGIPLIGRYIKIDNDDPDERERANNIGLSFCDSYESVDLTDLYGESLKYFNKERPDGDDNISLKVRNGNIKARLRMIYLYNLASMNHGIVIDNDNMTERLLGFWTLNGDVGDITPLASLMKTEVYSLANEILRSLGGNSFMAIQSVVNCEPCDGLGITKNDMEQLGCRSYAEVDDILLSILHSNKYDDVINNYLYPTYGKESVDKIINRYKSSEYKRNHPFRIKL